MENSSSPPKDSATPVVSAKLPLPNNDVVSSSAAATLDTNEGTSSPTKKRSLESLTGETGNDDEDTEDLGAKPAKRARFSFRYSGGEKESEGKVQVCRRQLMRSEEEFYQSLTKILKQYVKAALTIVIKKRRLCPSDGFQTVKVLGIKVPRFLQPSSLEYVDEVSKKFVTFMNRNVTDGCVLHVMIENNKTLHVIQRFVFKVFGGLNQQDTHEDILGNMLDLDEVRKRCRLSLLEINNSVVIKPMMCPELSRWSISLGMKQEFVNMDNESFTKLWHHDPSSGYFPWKKRPQSLANSGRRVSCKLDFYGQGLEKERKQTQKMYLFAKSLDGSSEVALDSKCKQALESESGTPVQSKESQCPTTDGLNIQKDASVAPDLLSNANPLLTQDYDGITCFPVSSLQVSTDLLLTLYQLEYPAPRPRAADKVTTTLDIRHRSPNISRRVSRTRQRTN